MTAVLQCCWMLKMQLSDVLPGEAHKEIHVFLLLTAVARHVFIYCSIPIIFSSMKMAAGVFQQIILQIE